MSFPTVFVVSFFVGACTAAIIVLILYGTRRVKARPSRGPPNIIIIGFTSVASRHTLRCLVDSAEWPDRLSPDWRVTCPCCGTVEQTTKMLDEWRERLKQAGPQAPALAKGLR